MYENDHYIGIDRLTNGKILLIDSVANLRVEVSLQNIKSYDGLQFSAFINSLDQWKETNRLSRMLTSLILLILFRPNFFVMNILFCNKELK